MRGWLGGEALRVGTATTLTFFQNNADSAEIIMESQFCAVNLREGRRVLPGVLPSALCFLSPESTDVLLRESTVNLPL